jgi:hypothetical protein
MNGSTHLNSAGFSIPSDLQQPVFSPAVRFAPKELPFSQVVRLIAYWAGIIAIALVMTRSGSSYVRHVWMERPGHHAVK